MILLKRKIINWTTIQRQWHIMKNGDTEIANIKALKIIEVQNKNNRTLKGIPKREKRNSREEVIFKEKNRQMHSMIMKIRIYRMKTLVLSKGTKNHM